MLKKNLGKRCCSTFVLISSSKYIVVHPFTCPKNLVDISLSEGRQKRSTLELT